MKYPNFSLERKLINQGYQSIVGIDEVGRGAWAGPLVAVAATVSYKIQATSARPRKRSERGTARNKKNSNPKFQFSKLKVKDSKLLAENIREIIFEKLSKKVIWSVGIVTHQEIDKLGLTKANILVIKRALRNLKIDPDYLLIDKVNGFKHRLPHQLIIKGDRKILSIAIASILAKVTRDRMMRDFHQKYPQYFFSKHKGYGTKLHQNCLLKNGTCKIHRQSYEPIKKLAF